MSIGTYPPQDTTLTIPLSIANGGTGATTAATARTNLGLGTMAQQDASAVAITGGTATVDGLGAGTPHAPGYNLRVGNAFSYIGGKLGIGQDPPRVELDVLNQAYIGGLGLGMLPLGGYHLATGTAPVYFGGKVRIGDPTGYPTSRLQLFFDRAANEQGLTIQPSADSGAPIGNNVLFLNMTGGVVGTIATTASATAYNTSSDARLKHAITALAGALAVVQALRPVAFRWNQDDSQGHGFLAHELQQVIADAVTGEPDAVNEDGSIKPQQVDHSKVVPWLTACCQELAQQVQVLQMEVAVLKGALA